MFLIERVPKLYATSVSLRVINSVLAFTCRFWHDKMSSHGLRSHHTVRRYVVLCSII